METPKILYQTWKTHDIPEKFQKNRKLWLDFLPPSKGWKHVLLDDNDLRNLVKDNFPEHLEAYDGFQLLPAHKNSLRITMVLQ